MPSFRINKVASLLKEELGLIFLHKIQDSRLSIITVTNVKVSPDLRHARIYLSVYDKEKRDLVLQKVNDLKGWIRTQIAARINLRVVPELDFYIDDTLDYVEKMEGLFKKIHENDNEKNSQ